MTRTITILGATGSVGSSTLDLVRRNRGEWRVEALTANCNVAELAALAREFGAALAVVADESCLPALRDALAGTGIEAAGGAAALREAGFDRTEIDPAGFRSGSLNVLVGIVAKPKRHADLPGDQPAR